MTHSKLNFVLNLRKSYLLLDGYEIVWPKGNPSGTSIFFEFYQGYKQTTDSMKCSTFQFCADKRFVRGNKFFSGIKQFIRTEQNQRTRYNSAIICGAWSPQLSFLSNSAPESLPFSPHLICHRFKIYKKLFNDNHIKQPFFGVKINKIREH